MTLIDIGDSQTAQCTVYKVKHKFNNVLVGEKAPNLNKSNKHNKCVSFLLFVEVSKNSPFAVYRLNIVYMT